MSIGQLNPILRHVRRLASVTGIDGLSDGQLLVRFQAHREESAFAALMRRHGRHVWSVCRHVLGHEQDAEDAFQATFLVLARKAGSIRKTEAVGSWLHGAAYRIAMRAKRDAAIRRKHEAKDRGANAPRSPARDVSLREGLAVLDEEVDRLPERHRAVFVACCLEGKTMAEAAHELGWKEGTVSGTLSRAKEKLRARLARRGVTLSVALAALALSDSAVAAVPVPLIAATLRAAVRYAAGGSAPAALASLIRVASRAALVAKAKIASVVLLLSVIASACCFALAASPVDDGKKANAKQQATAKPQATNEDTITYGGRVLDPAGKSVVGAKLYLRHQNLKEPAFPVRATSDADGKFSFTFKRSTLDLSFPEASWTQVIAIAKGYGPDWAFEDKAAGRSDLTLRLLPEVPIQGRILDVNGRPVKDAKLRIESFMAYADTEAFLQSVRDREWPRVNSKSWMGPFPGYPGTLTTDADGRFRLEGVGKDSLVEFYVQGPGIQWGPLRALAREIKAPVEPKIRQIEGPVIHTVYPATFDHVFHPSRLIRGVVRDKKTGRPVAGIGVSGHAARELAITDAEGRFTLDGFGKSAGGYGLSLRVPSDRYFSRTVTFPDTPGLGPVEGEIELVSGILVKGRVTHRVTGKPIEGAQVFYNPLLPNPFVRWFGPNGAGMIPCSMTTSGPDGAYSLVVLPGPGALGFMYFPRHETFMPALVTSQELKDFFKDDVDHGNEDTLRIQVTENGFNAVGQTQFNHILLINPGEKDGSFTRDVALQPAKPLRGKVVGPDGKPLAGATAFKLAPGIISQPLPDDSFTVEGLNPRRTHHLLFVDKDRKHGAFVTLKGEMKEPLTVRLEKCGSVTGRLLDQDGEPVAGAVVRIDADGPYDSGPAKVKTDGQGRFRFEGMVAGQSHQARFGPGPFGQYLYKPFTLKAGESKDLGDVQLKPKQ